MTHARKILGFLAMRAASTVAESIGRALDVPPHYPVEFSTALWCVDRVHVYERMYRDDDLNFIAISRVRRWGRFVIVVERAPDGGGVMLVLDARKEVRGGEAAALLRRNLEARAKMDAEAEAWLRKQRAVS